MATVTAGMTMSLDGFVDDPDGSPARLYPDLADLRGTDYMNAAIDETGAVVMGRRTFEMGDPDSYVGNYEFQVPIFVLTNHPPATPPKQDERLTFTFVTNGLRSAITRRRRPGGTPWFRWSAAPAWSSSCCATGSSMSCASMSCRWSWAGAYGCSRTSVRNRLGSRSWASKRSGRGPALASASSDTQERSKRGRGSNPRLRAWEAARAAGIVSVPGVETGTFAYALAPTARFTGLIATAARRR